MLSSIWIVPIECGFGRLLPTRPRKGLEIIELIASWLRKRLAVIVLSSSCPSCIHIWTPPTYLAYCKAADGHGSTINTTATNKWINFIIIIIIIVNDHEMCCCGGGGFLLPSTTWCASSCAIGTFVIMTTTTGVTHALLPRELNKPTVTTEKERNTVRVSVSTGFGTRPRNRTSILEGKKRFRKYVL